MKTAIREKQLLSWRDNPALVEAQMRLADLQRQEVELRTAVQKTRQQAVAAGELADDAETQALLGRASSDHVSRVRKERELLVKAAQEAESRLAAVQRGQALLQAEVTELEQRAKKELAPKLESAYLATLAASAHSLLEARTAMARAMVLRDFIEEQFLEPVGTSGLRQVKHLERSTAVLGLPHQWAAALLNDGSHLAAFVKELRSYGVEL